MQEELGDSFYIRYVLLTILDVKINRKQKISFFKLYQIFELFLNIFNLFLASETLLLPTIDILLFA